MKALNMTLNLMTLGGLIAAIDLVVDNTVIVLEMYNRLQFEKPHLTPKEVLFNALSLTISPMIWGTTAIALVFTPIGMLSGLAGMFFEPMATVHGMALGLSFVLAIFFLPGLILLFFSDKTYLHTIHHTQRPNLNLYSKILYFLLKNSVRNSLVFILIPLFGFISLRYVKTGFLPTWDEGDIVIDYRAEKPFGLRTTIQKIKPLEEYLKTIPEIEFFIRKTGTSLGALNKAPYMGEFIIKLKKERTKSVFQIIEEIQTATKNLNLVMDFDYFQILPDRLNDLTGSAKPIVLYLRSKDPLQLENATEKYKALLEEIPELDSVRIEEPPKVEEFHFQIDESKARLIDLNPSSVIQNARLGVFTVDSTNVQLGPESIPIRLSLPQEIKKSVESFSSLPIYTLRGGFSSLGELGKVELKKNRVESNHLEGNQVSVITAQLKSGDLGSAVF